MRLNPRSVRCRWRLLWLALLATVTHGVAGEPESVPATRFWWFPSLLNWTNTPDVTPNGRVLTGPVVLSPFGWNEAIVSWNAPTHVVLSVEAAPDGSDHWYLLGHWSSDTNAGPRTSVAGQSDAWGRVDTDTLVAARPAARLQVRIRCHVVGSGSLDASELRLGISLAAATERIPAPSPLRSVWGRKLNVPVLSQADYPEGVQSWCSPASLAMQLGWWRAQGMTEIPPWNVRETALGVYDPGWPGTGNWPFNAAFAGQQPGLSAGVARFAGLADVEGWIATRSPVAASVSYAQLNGAAKAAAGDGHLVVITGFTAQGDVEINDPGVRRERVTRRIPRAVFERAWGASGRTVYLVWPTVKGRPPGGDGRW